MSIQTQLETQELFEFYKFVTMYNKNTTQTYILEEVDKIIFQLEDIKILGNNTYFNLIEKILPQMKNLNHIIIKGKNNSHYSNQELLQTSQSDIIKENLLNFILEKTNSNIEILDIIRMKINQSEILYKNMKKFNNLQKFYLENTSAKNLYLSNKNLNEINAKNNFINDVTLLSTNLEKLNLENNKIENFTFLTNLKNLKYLQVNYNKIKSLEGLNNNNKLENLNLANCEIAQNTIDEKMINLQNLKELNLSNNRIEDLENFITPDLKILKLDNNLINNNKNFNFLNKNKNITHLYLNLNQLEKIYFLDLPNLIYLNLSSNKLKNIDNIISCKSLKSIDVEHNQIEELPNLNEFSKLENLHISFNKITKIEGATNHFGYFNILGNPLEMIESDNFSFSSSNVKASEIKKLISKGNKFKNKKIKIEQQMEKQKKKEKETMKKLFDLKTKTKNLNKNNEETINFGF